LSLFAPALPGPALRCESPGDSLAIGDSEGVLDADGEEDDGLDDGLDEGLAPEPPEPPEPPDGEGELLGWDPPPDPEPLPPPDPEPLPPPEPEPDPPPEPPPEPPPGLGEEVGDDVWDGVEVGEGVGVDVGVDVFVTGGATPGGTLDPAARSCCHDHATEPPAGTVSEPTP
jgi:hypothetical protein